MGWIGIPAGSAEYVPEFYARESEQGSVAGINADPWFNTYFGLGLSSVVFQEIRESKALAYSAYARYSSPMRRTESHYLKAYIGTQPDKLEDAIPALKTLLDDMPVDPQQMVHARQSIIRRLETEATPARKLYWRARLAWDRGYEHDLRRDLYRRMETATAGNLHDFHRNHVRHRP
ncbi:MAG: insulinase family protein, partial [Desulfobacterales bacterium]